MVEIINFKTKESTVIEKEPEELPEPVVNYQLEAIVSSLQEQPPIRGYIVILVDHEGDTLIHSSDMPRKDAFWLLEIAQEHAKRG